MKRGFDMAGKKLFITGTGTDVGKTYVAGLILQKLTRSGVRAAYYKAAMSGNERGADGALIPGDALYVKRVSGAGQPLDKMCPYVYEHAYSPHLAARLEKNELRMERVLDGLDDLLKKYDFVTVEGSGGILCPLRFDGQKIFLTDLIRARRMRCLLVSGAGLGSINAAGLTAQYMRAQGIALAGIVLNRYRAGDVLDEDNRRMIEYVAGARVLCSIGEGGEMDLSAQALLSLYD